MRGRVLGEDKIRIVDGHVRGESLKRRKNGIGGDSGEKSRRDKEEMQGMGVGNEGGGSAGGGVIGTSGEKTECMEKREGHTDEVCVCVCVYVLCQGVECRVCIE